MGKNQLRRDPLSGNWTIVLQNNVDYSRIIGSAQKRRPVQTTSCRYCEKFEHENPPEIYAIRNEQSNANEPGWYVRIIPEKFPVLQIHGDLNNRGLGIYDVLDGIGAHEIVVETPDHGTDLKDFDIPQLEKVLQAYKERFLDLKKDERFRYILMHKSPGDGEEACIDHAFSHIIATPITPLLVKEELANARAHYSLKERCLLCDVIRQEQEANLRVVLDYKNYIAISPFAAKVPFQLMILPKRHETFFEWNNELTDLATIMQQCFTKLKAILGDFDYVMVIHSGPNLSAGRLRGYWKTLEKDYHWHIEITPKIRSYSSLEISSGFQVNPVAPEIATRILRSGHLPSEQP